MKRTIKSLTEKMLTREEAMIYLLVTEGDEETYRSIANKIGMSHENVRIVYERAKSKIKFFTDLGVYDEKR